MPTVRIHNTSGAIRTLPVSGSHYAGLTVLGSYTIGQVKTGSVPNEIYEEFAAAMAAEIALGHWVMTQTAASWPIIERTEDIIAGPVADNVAATVTAPLRLRALGYSPISVRVYTVGAGAVGARTQTHYPLVDAAGTGWELGTYVETTGVLTLTNRSGGALSAIHVQVAWARVTV